MWLQEFLETILVLQPLCNHSSKLQIPFEFGASWCLWNLKYPCKPSSSSLKLFDATFDKWIPLNTRTIRKNPQDLWRCNEIIHFILEPWLSTINFLERTNLQSLLAPLQIIWLKKCLILKNLWTMRFLRPRENMCKWFNTLRVMRKWIYIQWGWQVQNFDKKQHSESIHTCVNPFR